MQPLASQAQFGAKARVGAVGQVAATGVAQRGEVHTNLVGTSGFQMHLHQRCGAEGFEHIVVGDGVASIFDHGELPFVAGVTADGRVNGAAQRVGQTLHERVVDLIHGAFFEGALELGVGTFASGYDHQAAGAHVQAVHNTLAFCRAGGGNRDALAHERGDDGGAVPARRGVRRHACGLIYHNNVVVQVNDAEAVHLFGADIRQIARCGCVHDDLVARGKLVGLADLHGLAVVGYGHVAVANPPGGAGSGRVEGAGERGVQAHTGKRAFNGEFGADACRIFCGVDGFAHAALLRVVLSGVSVWEGSV